MRVTTMMTTKVTMIAVPIEMTIAMTSTLARGESPALLDAGLRGRQSMRGG